MSILLEAVTEARELRQAAALEHAAIEKEWLRAIVRASEAGHSLREIARAAGFASHNTIRWHLLKERGDTKK